MRFITLLVLSSIILMVPLQPCRSEMREQRPNVLTGEFGGQTLVGFTYDHFFSNRFGIGAGVGYLVSFHLSWVPLGNVHSLYTSLGVVTNIMGSDPGEIVAPTLTFAWQFQSESGFILRLGITTYYIWPLPGIALGGSF